QKSSVGSYIGDVAVGDTAWVTFAIVAGNDLGGIKANTARAFEIAKNAGWTTKIINDPTDINNSQPLTQNFKLTQNYPNPFNPSTTIKYQLPTNVKSETANVKLIVFDILGRQVATLVNQKQNPGNYEVQFDANNLPSGVYFYKLTAVNFVETKKMVLLR
ncbi:MAG: T9SS type A sorting domain-containing protein, partial [Ignavibacteriae bacterium]|nr:T9SS type A sorting domain-containing protein [Ignavibacteriota bacterium]